MRNLWVVALAGGLAGCGAPGAKVAGSGSTSSEAPAKLTAAKPAKEADLAVLVLTPAAEQRLGVATAPVTEGAAAAMREFAGEIVLPPGRIMTVTAPVAGTLRGAALAVGSTARAGETLFTLTPLLPLPRDLRVTAEADVDQAKTRVETAKLRVARAEQMLKDEVGTVRAQEDARNELDLATSAGKAARLRLEQIQNAPLEGDVALTIAAPITGMIRQVLASPGQAVGGGAAVVEIVDYSSFWLRLPVYAGEAALVNGRTAVAVKRLSGEPLGTARPVTAPPTADPLASTVDFYFSLAGAGLRPGERVLVSVPMPGAGRGQRAVPAAAVLFDIHGGAWVYEQLAGHRYARHRVELDQTVGGQAHLRRGPPVGAAIVTAGAAELWGTEFGAGK